MKDGQGRRRARFVRSLSLPRKDETRVAQWRSDVLALQLAALRGPRQEVNGFQSTQHHHHDACGNLAYSMH